MSQVMENLNQKMRALAEKKVKAYLEPDLALDFERMTVGQVGDQYVWLLRECGTVIVKTNWLAYTNSPDFTHFSYYHPEQDILGAYEIQVNDITPEGLKGIIRKIKDYPQYHQETIRRAKESDRVVIGVVLKNGEMIQLEKSVNSGNLSYYQVLQELDLDESKVERMRYLDFSFN